jgi:malate dehydrogenase (oxaloacetate-decarboxylating)
LGGIPPEACLPVLLDVGTDNEERLNDPLYLGWRNRRVRGPQYDAFVDSFVTAVGKCWPHVLLQWEDFAGSNAARLLDRYRNQLCTFNDDIQGTAAVAAGTLLSAVAVTGVPLKAQRVAVFGFGSAGIGIAKLLVSLMQDEGLSEQEAYGRFYALDVHGLLVEGGKEIRSEQQPFVRRQAEIKEWQLSGQADIGLLDVIRNAKPTVLIGVSGQAGTFTEEAVRLMGKQTERPVIFPLSNPTSRSEATPEQLLDWTEGRALIGTGSPFDPVNVNGTSVHINQTNNSYIFPGLALGIISSRARHVSDAMVKTAAKTLAGISPTAHDKQATLLLPPLSAIRSVSKTIAEEVGKQAMREGLAGVDEAGFARELAANIWEPAYQPYELIGEAR